MAVAAPDAGALAAAERALTDWLGSADAVKAKTLPARLVQLLVDAGIRWSAAMAAGKLALAMTMAGRTRHGAPTPYAGMPTVRAVASAEPHERARYIIAAARRLTKAADEQRLADALRLEQWYAHLHLLAGRKRRAAAAKLDAVAGRATTGWLVWRAVLDERTTPDCAALNGRLFHISDPPGIPGAMHMACRCWAEPWGGVAPTPPSPGPVSGPLPGA